MPTQTYTDVLVS